MLAGAEILAGKSGKRHGEAGYREKGEPLDLGINTVPGGCEFAERVDICLDDNIRKRDYRILYRARNSVAYNLAQHIAVEADLFDYNGEGAVSAAQPYHTKHDRNRL